MQGIDDVPMMLEEAAIMLAETSTFRRFPRVYVTGEMGNTLR
jgi:hypothetical protein